MLSLSYLPAKVNENIGWIFPGGLALCWKSLLNLAAFGIVVAFRR